MKLRFTRHARMRLEARGIETDWVRDTLQGPERTERDARDEEVLLCYRTDPRFGGRVLRVAARPVENGYTVITAFFDRKERRRRSGR